MTAPDTFLVVAITRRPRQRLYDVTLENSEAITLSPDVFATSGLATGRRITAAQAETLRGLEARHSAMAAALRLLSYRPRSKAEVVAALRRKCVAPVVLEETVARLKQNGLLDDEAFARNYVEVRDRASPRSRRLLQAELAARGISRAAAAEAPAAVIDEADAAYRAGKRKARALPALPYAAFERRLGDHLLRRGFTFEVARATVRRLWKELHGGEAEDA